jgi:signal transduction histidine kinase
MALEKLKNLKLFKLRSLKQRWVLTSVLITVVIAFMGVAAWSIAIYSYYYSGVSAALEAKAKTSADFFSSYVAMTYAEYYQSAFRYTERFEDRDVLELQFIDTNGRVLVSTYGITAGTKPGTADIEEAIASRTTRTFRGRSPVTGERVLSVSSPMIYSNGQVVGVMRYVSGLKAVDKAVWGSILMAVIVAAAVIVIVVLLSLYFIRGIIKPIREVTEMTKHIAEGGFGGQISVRYDDEIGDMVGTINEMSMRLSQGEKLKTEFISSVSHELRTPLTAITGWSETILYDEKLSVESRNGVGIILKESRRLTNMVEGLLDFTRIEDGRFFVNLAPMDMEDLLEETIMTYGEIMRIEGLRVDYEPSEEPLPEIRGDVERLKQVLLNILDNAAKYAREGGRVIVRTELENPPEGGEFVAIIIRDFGPGVPPDELDKVKMKFYKGSSKERGSGIGLAVCDEIIRLHNGTLGIANAPEGTGLVVTIRLPVNA